jgi:hypothetical protein
VTTLQVGFHLLGQWHGDEAPDPFLDVVGELPPALLIDTTVNS